MTNHKLSLLHGKLQQGSVKPKLKLQKVKSLKFEKHKKSLDLLFGYLSGLSVLTTLSLNPSHSLPAHNKNTSFSHMIFVVIIIIIYHMKTKLLGASIPTAFQLQLKEEN